MNLIRHQRLKAELGCHAISLFQDSFPFDDFCILACQLIDCRRCCCLKLIPTTRNAQTGIQAANSPKSIQHPRTALFHSSFEVLYLHFTFPWCCDDLGHAGGGNWIFKEGECIFRFTVCDVPLAAFLLIFFQISCGLTQAMSSWSVRSLRLDTLSFVGAVPCPASSVPLSSPLACPAASCNDIQLIITETNRSLSKAAEGQGGEMKPGSVLKWRHYQWRLFNSTPARALGCH
jgi:hypothetical protein